MSYKKMDEQEWVTIGNQAKKTRKELLKLMDMSYGKMPKATVEPLRNALKHLDKFKSRAEDRMFQMGDSDNLDIFYGEMISVDETKKTFKEWVKEFKGIDRPIGDLAQDIDTDENFPDSDNFDLCLDYLLRKSVGSEVLDTFIHAYSYYKKDTIEG